jgi:hypothetical protein
VALFTGNNGTTYGSVLEVRHDDMVSGVGITGRGTIFATGGPSTPDQDLTILARGVGILYLSGASVLVSGSPLNVSGRLAVNTIDPSQCAFTIDDQACFKDDSNGGLNVHTADGTGYTFVNASAFNVVSATAEKKDITELGATDLVGMRRAIDELAVYSFRYRNEPEAEHPHTGVLAERVPKVILGRDAKSINLYDYLGVTVGATKEISRHARALEARLGDVAADNSRLRDENAALRARLDRLERAVAVIAKR